MIDTVNQSPSSFERRARYNQEFKLLFSALILTGKDFLEGFSFKLVSALWLPHIGKVRNIVSLTEDEPDEHEPEPD